MSLEMLGADDQTVPAAGQSWTDAATVSLVQAALNAHSMTDGSGSPLAVDGKLGPRTQEAIKKLQSALGGAPTGQIDEGVLSALQVTPARAPVVTTTRRSPGTPLDPYADQGKTLVKREPDALAAPGGMPMVFGRPWYWTALAALGVALALVGIVIAATRGRRAAA